MKKIIYGVALTLLIILGLGIYFVHSALPIGNGYTAKYLCSQVFLCGRDDGYVFEHEVKPTNALFSFIGHSVDYKNKTVTAIGPGFGKPLTAVYRDGFGCTLAVDTTRDELLKQVRGALPLRKHNPDLAWPDGEKVDVEFLPPEVDKTRLNKAVAEAFMEPLPKKKRNTQGVVVVYKGRIIAEKYAEGFSPATPILGWSMTKSVTNALCAILVKQKRLDIMKPAPVAAWKKPGDPRSKITLDELLRMSSGLKFDEVYGPMKDVTYMLYDSKSMAQYAWGKPLGANPDGKWHYSSGTANIIARIERDAVGGTLVDIYNFARINLFDKLNMSSAVIEPDASGSFVGSSYMFATPRDWARFGLFTLRDGVWNGERILPEGWMKYSTTPTPLAPKGEYGAQFWLNAGEKDNPENRMYPSLPVDLYFLSGYNSQVVAVIPSRDVVIVRMGVTHDKSAWPQEKFIRQVLESITKR
ncbi:MAG: serine hydrolase, partial [Syntrophales bacterium]|nr:serine hydrolase [Syntrophales bacterium]